MFKNLDENKIENIEITQDSSPDSCPYGSTRYRIQPGDTFYSIAQRFGVTVECLIQFNPQYNLYDFMPYSEICIPPVWACPAPPCPEGVDIITYGREILYIKLPDRIKYLWIA